MTEIVAPPIADVVTPDPLTSAALTAIVFLLGVRLLDVWEREPLWLMLLLAFWGAVGAVAIAKPGNEAVLGALSADVATVWGPAISAPIVEELAKGVALLGVFFATRRLGAAAGKAGFDGVVDGIVYGAAIGIGFAFAENNFYFLQQEDIEQGYEVLNVREGFLNLNVLGHAVFTGTFGAGLGLASRARDRGKQVLFALLGFSGAFLMHAVHNGLVAFLLVQDFGLDATAAAFAGQPLPVDLATQMKDTASTGEMATSILDFVFLGGLLVGLVLGVRSQRNVLAEQLAEEVDAGVVTRDEYELVTGYGRRMRMYARMGLRHQVPQARSVRETHAEVVGLAFLKSRSHPGAREASVVERQRRKLAAIRSISG